ncbi:MAG: hypothetical protein IMHGJWDQ_001918 [Candidatus Fervidibacter sp.]
MKVWKWFLQWWQGRQQPLSAPERGRKAEREASLFLRRRGYRIIAQNLRLPAGEIDLVAVKGEWVVFVEVKARSSDEFGMPVEALTLTQQKRIRRAAEQFLAKQGWSERPRRFDLIAVDMDERGRILHMEHLVDAF